MRVSVADMVELKVRIRGRHRPPPPEVFYQSLPMNGLALLATLPRGNFAVSIPSPRENSWRGGFPFTKTPPEPAADPVVIYRLQLNSRYEAVAVRHHGREYALEEFVEIAAGRAREYWGGLEKISGGYAYATPEKEEWSDILRDSGYVALNPERIIPAPVAPSGRSSPFGNTIRIRAPLYGGRNDAFGAPSVFARVDVLPDASDNPKESRITQSDGAWLDFDAYRKKRAEQAVVPAEIVSDFEEWLERLTRESGFDAWRFRPGMCFGDQTEWWGARGRRRTEHEGLDFVEGFRDQAVSLIPEGTPVHALASGELAAVLDDFMGKTVVVRHPALTRPGGEVFHTLFSHIQTEPSLPDCLDKNSILGRVGKKPGVYIRPHLHLSCAWLPADFPVSDMGIDVIHPGFTQVALADSNRLIEKNPLCLRTEDDRTFLMDD